MDELHQDRSAARSVFPQPAAGSTLGVNPDGFVWLPVENATSYELRVWRTNDERTVLREHIDEHYYVPRQPLPTGTYEWTIVARRADGTAIGKRSPWAFTVPADVPIAVPPRARDVLADVDPAHPRLVFPAAALDAHRDRITAAQRRELEGLVADAIDEGMPPAPTFHLKGTHDERRQHYQDYFVTLRGYIDRNLRACALADLLVDDEDAGAFAREMLLHVCAWNPEGPNSVDWHWGDEPGLSYARILPQVYDWTYERYDEDERTYIEHTLVQYARQTYDRLVESEYFTNPSRSHLGRLPGYLGEMAILLEDRLEEGEAERMLDLAIDIFATFFPHWGGDNGGWAQGISYGRAYNKWYVPFFATLERQTGFSFWDRPFYRRVGDFFVYCAPPGTEDLPFGDGQDGSSPGGGIKTLLSLYGGVYDDPVMAWRADQIDGGHQLPDLTGVAYPPYRGDVDGAGQSLPNARAFHDIGWAAVHSDLATPDDDNYLVFRSSRYGNVSHSHNNQNAFAISAGGHSLAISSGYYVNYGSPHHAEWTRATKAHNCVTVDGQGQERGVEATGALTAFEAGDGFAYVRGEAGSAYADDVLTRFDRHILFVAPGLYVLCDDLAAPTASQFEWHLHTHEAPAVDASGATIEASRGPANLRCRLFGDGELELEHWAGFDPDPNEGLIEELQVDKPDQHHVTARTEPLADTKLVAVLSAWQDTEPGVSCAIDGEHLHVESARFTGTVALGDGPVAIRGELKAADPIDIAVPDRS